MKEMGAGLLGFGDVDRGGVECEHGKDKNEE